MPTKPTESQPVRPVGRHSYGRYEAIRVFVPAVYLGLLVLMFSWTTFTRTLSIDLSAGQGIVLFTFVVLIAAMSLYGKELPKRRRAFSTNQPSFYLSTRARTMKDMPLLSDEEARRVYFYLLNTYVPDAFHEKIFFFGAVYTVLITMRRITLWFAAFGTAVAIAQRSGLTTLADMHGLAVLRVILWLVYALAVYYNKAERKMQENYQDQIFWLQMNDEVVQDVLRRAKEISAAVNNP